MCTVSKQWSSSYDCFYLLLLLTTERCTECAINTRFRRFPCGEILYFLQFGNILHLNVLSDSAQCLHCGNEKRRLSANDVCVGVRVWVWRSRNIMTIVRRSAEEMQKYYYYCYAIFRRSYRCRFSFSSQKFLPEIHHMVVIVVIVVVLVCVLCIKISNPPPEMCGIS